MPWGYLLSLQLNFLSLDASICGLAVLTDELSACTCHAYSTRAILTIQADFLDYSDLVGWDHC